MNNNLASRLYEVSCPNSDEVLYLTESELNAGPKYCGLCNVPYEVTK